MIVNCPKCGEKTVLLNGLCEHCGCKTKVCPECGNIVEESAKKCDYCGVALEETAESKEQEARASYEKSKKQAVGLINYAEKAYNIFFIITTTVGLLAALICIGAATFKFFDFCNYGNKSAQEIMNYLTRAEEIKETICTLLLIGLLLLFVLSTIGSFKGLITLEKTWEKIDEVNFDYKTYYANASFDARGKMQVMSRRGQGDYTLINAIICREDPSKKTKRIVMRVIFAVLQLTATLLIYFGLVANVEANMSNAIKLPADKFEYVFDFTLIIIGAVVEIIAEIIDKNLGGEGARSAEKWVRQIQYENKENRIK